MLFCLNNRIVSQNYIDILKVNGATTSVNKFDTSSSTTKINEIGADLTVPIKINQNTSLLSGVIYENIQTKLFEDGNYVSLSSVTLKVGMNKVFSEKWSGTAVLLPKLASDFIRVGQKDFQMGGIALMKFKKSSNVNYKFGLYYNSELFGPFFVPMIGLYYLSPNKKFETNIMLPLQADVNYKIIPFMNIGFNFNGQIRSYHVTDITPTQHSDYVARSTNEFFAYLKFNVSKSLSIQTKVGQSVGRSYKVYADNDKVNFGLPATFIGPKRQQLNTNFSNGQIFQVTLLYRFNLDKKVE